MSNAFVTVANAHLTIGGHVILWREIVGNAFGLASAVGGMRRRIWAWPVGIVGNVLLFTVFLGAAFGTPQGANLLGQAGRQVMFVVVSVYGWVRWRQARAAAAGPETAAAVGPETGDEIAAADPGPEHEGTRPATTDGAPVQPRWASWRERGLLVLTGVIGVALLTPIFSSLGSFPPVWADAWIFTGSMLATYAMARGWVEFWLIWIAVDAVGVPLLLRAHLYPSATLYLVYAAFVLWGFFVWWGISRREPQPSARTDVLRAAGR